KAHLGEINAVAVAQDGNTFVSGSEAQTIHVWRRDRSGRPLALSLKSPVRALACTPPAAKRNLCAAGLADGRIFLWDLDQLAKGETKPLLHIRDAHRDPRSALAFT